MNLNHCRAEARENSRARRAIVAEIAEAGRFLEDADRDLVRTVFEHGVPAARVARAMGRPPYEVARRIKRLERRLCDPYARFVIARHVIWPEHRREIGLCFFVRGLTQRATAERLDTTVHRVRQELQFIRGLFEAELAQAVSRVQKQRQGGDDDTL